jgi:sensor c-di-GMP phosphodiesterase-like protein
MKMRTIVAASLVLAAAAVSLPVWLALHEADRRATDAESANVLGFARDILQRSDETLVQVHSAIDKLAAAFADAPCSAASLELMRQIDLNSSYIQSVGHVEGDKMVCSSLGAASDEFILGPPDLRTPEGIIVRGNVRLRSAPGNTYIALEQYHFAAIIHKSLPIDTAKSATDLDFSLAIIALQSKAVFSSRGFIDRRWMPTVHPRMQATFSDGHYLVAVVTSSQFQTAAIAAIPISHLETRAHGEAQRLVPIGLLAGILLTLPIGLYVRRQMAAPATIKAGLRHDEFYLVYQPLINLPSGKCVGMEALLRWRRPVGKEIGPDEFIPIAEQSDLIVELTQRVLDLIARDTGHFLATRPDFHVGINVSAADLKSPSIVKRLQQLVERTRGRPANFILEITERGLVDLSLAKSVIDFLRQLGFAIAVDDFGTGYSSLSYLESLDLDYLKIDRSFVETIDSVVPTRYLVQHIIEMSKGLRLRTVAEGVQSEAQANFLRTNGVPLAQGWLYAKGMPFAEFVANLEAAER